MKRLFLMGAVASLGVISCSKAPKCNDEEVKKEVISAFKKAVASEVEADFKSVMEGEELYSRILPVFKNVGKHLDDLEIKLTETTSTDVKADIKKCFCEASFNTVEKTPITDKMVKEILESASLENHNYKIENFTPTIKYSAQITDDKTLKVVIDNMKDLEIIKNNVSVKLMNDMIKEAKKFEGNTKRSAFSKLKLNNQSSTQNTTLPYDDSVESGDEEYYSNAQGEVGVYYVNASDYQKVYFHNAPDPNTRRNAHFSTYEEVYVSEVRNGFGYVVFTNSSGQTSKGWIRMLDLQR